MMAFIVAVISHHTILNSVGKDIAVGNDRTWTQL